jgi:hypothetical protein
LQEVAPVTLVSYVWWVAGFGIGFALGLYFGRLLTAVLADRERVTTAVNLTKSISVFVLGGGAGAIIFERLSGGKDVAPFYVLGLAFALIGTFFWPKLPPRYTLRNVEEILWLGDALRDEVPDVRKRALLVLTRVVPPEVLQRSEGMSTTEYASQLEGATDAAKQPPKDKTHDA